MSGLEDFLRRNPALKDEDPEKLADYVYDTKIKASGADRDDFKAYFLGTATQGGAVSSEKGNVLDRAGDAVVQMAGYGGEAADAAKEAGGNWLQRAGGKIVDAWRGDAEHDLPSIDDSGLKRGLKVGVSAALGSDEEYAQAVVNANPGHSMAEDANGNIMIVNDETGKPVTYPNSPGFDTDDAGRFFVKAASFVPAGKVAAGAGKAATALGRFGQRASAGAITNALTDGAMQEGVVLAGGKEKVDQGQVATAGIIGGAGEAVLSPLVGRMVKAIGTKAPTDAEAMRVARAALRDNGGADGFTEDQLKTMGLRIIESGDLVTTEAAKAEAQGIKLTRGQMMPDGTEAQRTAKYNQLSMEEELKSLPEKQGQRVRDLDKANDKAIDRNVEAFQDRITNGNSSEGVIDAAEKVKTGAKSVEQRMAAETDAAYKEFENLDGYMTGDSLSGLHKRIDQRVNPGNVYLDSGTPAANRAMKTLKGFSERVAEEGETSPASYFEAVERQRQLINRQFKSVSKDNGDNDKRMLTEIKNAFDDELDMAFRAGLYEGDPEILTVVQKARGKRAAYGSKFQDDTQDSGKSISELIKSDTTPEKAIQQTIGKTGMSGDAANVAKRYRDIVGENSESWGAFREMAILTVMRAPNSDKTKGRGALVKALSARDNGHGSSLMKEIFDEDERAVLRNFAEAIEQTFDKDNLGNPSGTANKLLRSLNNGRMSHLKGLSSMMHNMLQKRQSALAVRAPKLSVRPEETTIGLLQASQAESRNR